MPAELQVARGPGARAARYPTGAGGATPVDVLIRWKHEKAGGKRKNELYEKKTIAAYSPAERETWNFEERKVTSEKQKACLDLLFTKANQSVQRKNSWKDKLRDIEKYKFGLRIDELSVKCLLYADDQVILAQSACELQEIVTKMNDSVKRQVSEMDINLNSNNSMMKLEGADNWNIWKFQTTVLLRGQGWLDIVEGRTLKPEDPAEHSAWENKDAKAQTLLVTRMTENVMLHIITCSTSAEMWRKLQSVYEQKTETNIHIIQQRFFQYKFEPGTEMSTFLSKIQELQNKLKQLGEEVSNKFVITKVLMSLPDEYKHFVSAWESAPDNKQTMDNLVARLLIEEERIKEKSEQLLPSGSSAFWVVDSGASEHMCRDRGLFTTFTESKHESVIVGNGAAISVLGYGQMAVEVYDGTCGVSQKNRCRCRNSDVRERCGLKEDVVIRLKRGMLRWCGHLGKEIKQFYRANLCDGKVGKGRPRNYYADHIGGTINEVRSDCGSALPVCSAPACGSFEQLPLLTAKNPTAQSSGDADDSGGRLVREKRHDCQGTADAVEDFITQTNRVLNDADEGTKSFSTKQNSTTTRATSLLPLRKMTSLDATSLSREHTGHWIAPNYTVKEILLDKGIMGILFLSPVNPLVYRTIRSAGGADKSSWQLTETHAILEMYVEYLSAQKQSAFENSRILQFPSLESSRSAIIGGNRFGGRGRRKAPIGRHNNNSSPRLSLTKWPGRK
ncbi:Retrovirus-related Pol polyprotein from transposon TNT 1-94 [Eumeta japonica]|uniref:Retrovirus-related Pol polyprotein from transposon TNT 1-94 n=1 Tax=Eumeta variegata TaxID=151549 RepID=A0A4C1Z7M7_EUMVA|nr:Retrovirus-related Pol polyprotein from transposon TNT 1-94 [Eumeta japonica]